MEKLLKKMCRMSYRVNIDLLIPSRLSTKWLANIDNDKIVLCSFWVNKKGNYICDSSFPNRKGKSRYKWQSQLHLNYGTIKFYIKWNPADPHELVELGVSFHMSASCINRAQILCSVPAAPKRRERTIFILLSIQ